ncbi:MAG: hypothetical protein M1378_01110 [Bacteroidetes bacterium]|jgi:hypothetical protein|nr:hypothetical protein [Bacteroidota bacterium]MCL5033995.1 hypothetical protein [Bacteroidota bacterium]
MGTGQMLLTVGAIILLGTIILSTNRSLNDNDEILLKTNFGLEEVSLATSVMEEAQDKAFDQQTIAGAVTSLSQLTPPGSLGQENGDSSDLDDFDDYNGLNNNGLTQIDTMKVDTLIMAIYYVRTRVCYVDIGDLNGSSPTPTWSKRLDVSVWNKYDPGDTVKMSTIFSYWYFR